jgi:hypothetical protein
VTTRKARKIRQARAFLRMEWPTMWVDEKMRRDPEYWASCDARLSVERAAWAYLAKHAPNGYPL